MSPYLSAFAAFYLLVAAVFIDVPNKRSAFIFKVVPFVLASLLGFTAYAQYMGWPA